MSESSTGRVELPPQTAGGGTDGAEADAAVAFILRSTRQRPQTRAELAAKLTARQVAPPAREAALTRAEELGAVDDDAFARAWVEDRGRGRGYGIPRLRRELDRRGVPAHVREQALERLADRDPLAVATELAQRRAAQLPGTLAPQVVARRLVAYLARRGYDESLARRVAISVSGLDRRWD